ncbi:MAG: aconitate hydratase [Myxococcota bacterium]
MDKALPTNKQDWTAFYQQFDARVRQHKQQLKRPLTLAEKILLAHMQQPLDEEDRPLRRGRCYVNLWPRRVAMQDVTGQMALLQFMSTQQPRVAVPASVHCDHLIEARAGVQADLPAACKNHEEVYTFLKTACQKYGIDFWEPGSGIIHQVVLEHAAVPGGLLIGTDSHTPNAGGLGMLAIGVGGGDAVDVLAGGPLNLAWPRLIGVQLTGQLQGWSSPKDVILKLMGLLGVRGGTGCIVEFFGSGCSSLSATGKATITNMGAEHGATTSLFPYDEAMNNYLCATQRHELAQAAQQMQHCLRADDEVLQDPANYYDQLLCIDLSNLEPHIVGPHSPDLSRPITAMQQAVAQQQYPDTLAAALIGSCTNSSYEDLGRAAAIAKQATALGLRAKVPFYVTPGSQSVYETAQQAGYIDALKAMGGVLLSNACGPCIGQWHRTDQQAAGPNSIVSSYNRNFPGRNDGKSHTLSFLASPEMVTAMALFGRLSCNPLQQTLPGTTNKVLQPPQADVLPTTGMHMNAQGRVTPPADGSSITVHIAPNSNRLASLAAFAPCSDSQWSNCCVLFKAKGKCTTDHISPAGKWLQYRGHLDKIADNTYLGVVNSFTTTAGTGIDITQPNEPAQLLCSIARRYKARQIPWVAVGDTNFGEGSSREHAAMQPRYLGCVAVLARSFARIHETNLKKSGILPLTFTQESDYNCIGTFDRIDVLGLDTLATSQPVRIVVRHSDGSADHLQCNHTLSPLQIAWFHAGSSLNYLTRQAAAS